MNTRRHPVSTAFLSLALAALVRLGYPAVDLVKAGPTQNQNRQGAAQRADPCDLVPNPPWKCEWNRATAYEGGSRERA